MDRIPLLVGTVIHEKFKAYLTDVLGLPIMAEVNLTPWLPRGWGGTADLFVYLPQEKKFKLMDVKTTKGDAIYFIKRDGAKAEHKYQTSAYYHAAKRAGIQMVPEIDVFYIPKDGGRNRNAEPLIASFKPIPAKTLDAVMDERYKATKAYVTSLPEQPARAEDFLTEWLAPPQERLQKVIRRDDVPELRLVPHWSTQYCSYPFPLCGCGEQGQTKIGHFEGGVYVPREGYEKIKPEVFPT